MLNFNGVESQYSLAPMNGSYPNVSSEQASCQMSSFVNEYAKPQHRSNSVIWTSGVIGNSCAIVGGESSGASQKYCHLNGITQPADLSGSYLPPKGSDNVKRFSVNNLLQLATCAGGSEEPLSGE